MQNKENYILASCKITPYLQDYADILSMHLSEYGFESFVDTDFGVEAYIIKSSFSEILRENLLTYDHELFAVEYSFEEIISQNWNEEWEKNYFEPLHVGDSCVVRASFHPSFPNCQYELIIEPKMAFGTGNHETTYLMMEQILKLNFSDKMVLDMGCGTGVLAILASMMGAKEITAIDYDVWSYESAMENAEKNKVVNINVLHGDANILGEKTFDVIFANIHKNVLINDVKNYAKVLNKGGILMMSGFYSNDLEDIKREAKANGLAYSSHTVKKDWNMAVFTS